MGHLYSNESKEYNNVQNKNNDLQVFILFNWAMGKEDLMNAEERTKIKN